MFRFSFFFLGEEPHLYSTEKVTMRVLRGPGFTVESSGGRFVYKRVLMCSVGKQQFDYKRLLELVSFPEDVVAVVYFKIGFAEDRVAFYSRSIEIALCWTETVECSDTRLNPCEGYPVFAPR